MSENENTTNNSENIHRPRSDMPSQNLPNAGRGSAEALSVSTGWAPVVRFFRGLLRLDSPPTWREIFCSIIRKITKGKYGKSPFRYEFL